MSGFLSIKPQININIFGIFFKKNKYFQVYVLVDLFLFIVSYVWSHPLGYQSWALINEVVSNYGFSKNSYIELFAGNGFNDNVLNQLYCGILVVDPELRGKRSKVRIVAAFDLKLLRESNKASQYFVLGNPKSEWTPEDEEIFNDKIDYERPSRTEKQIYGPLAEWLDVKQRAMKMVILTCHRDTSFTIIDKLKPPTRHNQKYPYLEDNEDLVSYLKVNQMDIVILVGKSPDGVENEDKINVHTTCALLNGLFEPRLQTYGRLNPYLPAIIVNPSEPTPVALIRCSLTNLPFNHLSFKHGGVSPGTSNVEHCRSAVTILKNHNIETTQRVDNKRRCNQDGTCLYDHHSMFYQTSGQQFLADFDNGQGVVRDYGEAVCGSPDELRQNMAAIRNRLSGSEAKRRKLWHVYEDKTCPNDPFLPVKRERKRHIRKTILLVQRFQSTKVDVADIIANSEWICYNFNPDAPGDSTFYCCICAGYSEEFNVKQNHRSALSYKSGELKSTIELNRRSFRNHIGGKIHKRLMQLSEEKAYQDLENAIHSDVNQNEPVAFKITNRHMRLVFAICKTETSLASYQEFAEAMRRSGFDMGDLCRSHKTAYNMAKAISEIYLRETINDILLSDSPISIMVVS